MTKLLTWTNTSIHLPKYMKHESQWNQLTETHAWFVARKLQNKVMCACTGLAFLNLQNSTIHLIRQEPQNLCLQKPAITQVQWTRILIRCDQLERVRNFDDENRKTCSTLLLASTGRRTLEPVLADFHHQWVLDPLCWRGLTFQMMYLVLGEDHNASICWELVPYLRTMTMSH